MNAITRVYQEQIGLNPFAGMVVSGYYVAISLLFFCVFSLAVGVVYMKDLNRRLFIQYQGLQQMQQQYGMIFNFKHDVIFVRHAESVGNTMSQDERAALEIPNHQYPLTPRGREQARITGEYLKSLFEQKEDRSYRVVVPHQSTFLRTQETMDIIQKVLGRWSPTVPVTDSRLDEKWDGIFHELSKKEIEERYPEQIRLRKRSGYYHYRAPGGENCLDVEMRIRSFMSDLILKDRAHDVHAGKKASCCELIVCHGRWFQIFQRYFHNLSLEDFLEMKKNSENHNCSVTLYDHYEPGNGYWGIPGPNTPWKGILEETENSFA